MSGQTLSISVFCLFLLVTLGITWRVAARAGTAAGFYAAHGAIGPRRNALALAGDFISAAAFLGVTGIIFTSGYDGVFYAVGAFAGWPLMLILLAERLRRLGRYTFADVLAAKLHEPTARVVGAATTIVIVLLYLLGQMVGAGALVAILFGTSYTVAVVSTGCLMAIYVAAGGMAATTWVQIIKAVLLLGATGFMMLAVLVRFDGDLGAVFDRAAAVSAAGERVFAPGGLVGDPVSMVSLGLALVLGTCGLPHVLMRFFTVADARAARQSVAMATAIIGLFSILTVLLGYGALAILDPGTVGNGNTAVLALAKSLGGDLFFAVTAAVTFATILAVVSGLTLAGASAVSHDLVGRLLLKGRMTDAQEVRLSRLAVVAIAVIATAAALAFEGQNIAFLVSLAVAVAAGVNTPLLLATVYWRGMTSQGLAWGGAVGLSLSVVLIVLSPAVWERAMGLRHAPFSYDYPTLFVLPATFVAAVIASLFSSGTRTRNAEPDPATD
jgi:cation/acetate symporter